MTDKVLNFTLNVALMLSVAVLVIMAAVFVIITTGKTDYVLEVIQGWYHYK